MTFLYSPASLPAAVGAMLCLATLPWAASAHTPQRKQPKTDKLWVYVGTYTEKTSKGIYRFDMDAATGKLTPRGLVAETANPTFLAIHPNHRFLYAVGETDNFHGKKSGAVNAYAIDGRTGNLTRLNQQPSKGAGPCHLVVDREGRHVLAANYGGGSVCVLAIEPDGQLGKATAFVQHRGSSVNKQRQEGPHAHCVRLDADNRFAFVADLGLDKVLVYRYDPTKGTLKPNDPPTVDIAPGAGPRHLAFTPNSRYAYVINEMGSTITAMSYNAKDGVLKALQTVSTLPKEFKGETTAAEIEVHPSGKFLYGSNRGQDSIVIFTIDPGTGELSYVSHQSYKIKIPRNFAIDPTGKYMVVANQDADSLVVFRIDPKTGKLVPTGTLVEAPMPVCVVMMPAGG